MHDKYIDFRIWLERMERENYLHLTGVLVFCGIFAAWWYSL